MPSATVYAAPSGPTAVNSTMPLSDVSQPDASPSRPRAATDGAIGTEKPPIPTTLQKDDSMRLSEYKPQLSGLDRNSSSMNKFENEDPNDDGVSKWHKGFSEQINDVCSSKERMIMQQVSVILAMIGLLTSSYGNHLLWENSNVLNNEVNLWKGFTSASTLLLLVCVWQMHAFDLNIEKARGYVAPESHVFSTGRHNNFFRDILFCAVHSPYGIHFVIKEEVTGADPFYPPGYDGINIPIYAHHSLDSLTNVFMTSRLFLLFPLIHHFLGLTGAGPRLVARYTNIIFDMNFTLKAILDKHSFFAIFILIIVMSMHASWLLHVLERAVCVHWDEEQWEVVAYQWGYCGEQQVSTFENIFDSFWHSVVTMTSVGYGDLTPVTMLGRITSIWASFLGIVILALLVNVMTDMTTFKARERKAFDLIQRGLYRSTTTKLAATLLQHCWLAHKYHRDGDKRWTSYKKKYYITYRKWKGNLREILVNENKVDDVAIITTELSGLRRDFKEMLFTTTVDLEDRLDRRMLRLLREVHDGNQMARRVSNFIVGNGKIPGKDKKETDSDFKRRLTRFISKLPEDAIHDSIEHGAHHEMTDHEREEAGHLEARLKKQHEVDTTVAVPEKKTPRGDGKSVKRDEGGLSDTGLRRNVEGIDLMEAGSLSNLNT